jgi:hypothetical protein
MVYVRSTQDTSAGARTARSDGEGERRRGLAGDTDPRVLLGFKHRAPNRGESPMLPTRTCPEVPFSMNGL